MNKKVPISLARLRKENTKYDSTHLILLTEQVLGDNSDSINDLDIDGEQINNLFEVNYFLGINNDKLVSYDTKPQYNTKHAGFYNTGTTEVFTNNKKKRKRKKKKKGSCGSNKKQQHKQCVSATDDSFEGVTNNISTTTTASPTPPSINALEALPSINSERVSGGGDNNDRPSPPNDESSHVSGGDEVLRERSVGGADGDSLEVSASTTDTTTPPSINSTTASTNPTTTSNSNATHQQIIPKSTIAQSSPTSAVSILLSFIYFVPARAETVPVVQGFGLGWIGTIIILFSIGSLLVLMSSGGDDNIGNVSAGDIISRMVDNTVARNRRRFRIMNLWRRFRQGMLHRRALNDTGNDESSSSVDSNNDGMEVDIEDGLNGNSNSESSTSTSDSESSSSSTSDSESSSTSTSDSESSSDHSINNRMDVMEEGLASDEDNAPPEQEDEELDEQFQDAFLPNDGGIAAIPPPPRAIPPRGDRFQLTAETLSGQDEQICDQVRRILRQNDREDLVRLRTLDDRTILDAMRHADHHDDADPHDQTINAALFIIDNEHCLHPDDDDDDDY